MPVSEIITLSSVWKFISPALQESLKTVLKGRSSEKKARERAYELFQNLRQANTCMDDFIIALADYTNIRDPQKWSKVAEKYQEVVEKRIADNEPRFSQGLRISVPIAVTFEKLNDAACRLKIALLDIARSLKAVDPQLNIHRPEIVRQVNIYAYSEARTLESWLSGVGSTQEEFDSLRNADSETLNQLLRAAKSNRDTLVNAVNDLRRFIAKEFSFKESF